MVDIYERKAVRDQIIGCSACDLRAGCRAPVPFRGPSPASLAVLGEAPGRQEDREGVPFIGPAGKRLDDWLTTTGIDLTDVAYFNAVCCFPNREGKACPPTEAQVGACRGNLVEQMRLIDPLHVLIVGQSALSAVAAPVKLANGSWYDARLTDYRNKWFRWPWNDEQQPWCYVTYHPAAGLRQNKYDEAAREDLDAFQYMRVHGLASQGAMCIVCRYPAVTWYRTVGYCGLHYPAEQMIGV